MPTPEPVSVLIVDDEPIARRGMRRLVEGRTDMALVGEGRSAAEARQRIATLRPALVLLDIQMPGLSGLDLLRDIPERERPLVIFVSAYDAYAIDAFDVRAVDYLLKPFTNARFDSALDRAIEALALRRNAATGSDVAAAAPHIVVRGVGRTEMVNVSDLRWVEAVDYYVRLHARGKPLLHRETLDAMQARLDASEFVRVHRSALVRHSEIRTVVRGRTGMRSLELKSGERVPVSRSGWTLLRARLEASSALAEVISDVVSGRA